MRIDEVLAGAFGPFKGETLRLAPGMTVVHGPNEAGKSTWHAALYAGLCGRRRGRGAHARAERAFAEAHRPWDSDRWEVGVIVTLADGRRVELRHDLAGRVDCRATDLVLGRDVSHEIMVDGAPDGAAWLGLTRRTLPATVCVGQADLLGVLDDPDALQETLQRAAATGGTDATAEQALERIAAFRRDHIGAARRNSTKPLQAATARLDGALRALADARAAHERYVELLGKRDRAAQAAAVAGARLDAARYAVAAREVDRLERRLEQARTLHARFPDGAPADATADDDGDEVAEALAVFASRPRLPSPPSGPTAAELQAAVDALPDPPAGDTRVAAEVEEAAAGWARAGQALDWHDRHRPPPVQGPALPPVTAAQLREAADELQTPQQTVDAELADRVSNARRSARAGGTGSRVARGHVTAGALAATAGAALLLVDRPLAGLLLLLAGMGLIAVGLARPNARPAPTAAPLHALEARLALQHERAAQAEQRRTAARRRLQAWGAPADPAQARRLARALEDADDNRERLRRWADQHLVLTRQHDAEAAGLAAALRRRGVALGDGADVSRALVDYRNACEARARQAAEAAQRAGLAAQLAARRDADAAVAAAAAARADAERRLRRAGAARGVVAADADELAGALREWHRRAAQERRSRERRRQEWAQLCSLLDGRSLVDLETDVARARAHLPVAPRGHAAALDDDVGAQLRRLEAQRDAAAAAAAEARGRVADREASLPSVAEAEEAVEQAAAERDRLRALDATLEATRGYLEAARDRVHRDIAPQLSASVQARLPAVTQGRYREVTVDPASLQVRVRGVDGRWRPATALSHGTAEQVYLLLRVAMAEHLVTTAEPAPLLLDDVSVQSDTARTRAILDTLHAVSGERQVVVFTQEDALLEWARANLQRPRDAVVELTAVPVSG